MLIKVTQAHIDAGIRRQCNQCPVSLAIVDSTQCADAFVAFDYVSFHRTDGAAYERIQLPPKATTFIRDFDRRLPVTPFEFELPC